MNTFHRWLPCAWGGRATCTAPSEYFSGSTTATCGSKKNTVWKSYFSKKNIVSIRGKHQVTHVTGPNSPPSRPRQQQPPPPPRLQPPPPPPPPTKSQLQHITPPPTTRSPATVGPGIFGYLWKKFFSKTSLKPDGQIYKKRTIEVICYTDKSLWKQMRSRFPNVNQIEKNETISQKAKKKFPFECS